MKAVHIQQFNEKLALGDLPKPVVTGSQVLVKAKYAPINPMDVYYTMGYYGLDKSLPATVGFEGSGVVVEAGEDAYAQSLIGKSVGYYAKGTWAEYVVADSTDCINFGENISEEDYQKTCSSYVNPMTALAFLHEVKSNGETSIVHSAAKSTIGTFLIKAAKSKGITTINIVRKEEQIQQLLDMGADYVLNSTNANFDEQLAEIIAKVKPMSFFDGVGGEFLTKLFSMMPNKSKTYSYGGLSGKGIENLDPSDLVFKQKILQGFWLIEGFLPKISKEVKLSIINEVASTLLTYGTANIHKIYEASEVANALQDSIQNSSKGKVLLKF